MRMLQYFIGRSGSIITMAIALSFLTGFALGTTTTFQPSSADAVIDAGAKTANDGNNSILQTYPWTGSSYSKRSIIKFDLSSISGSTISSATLSLYVTSYYTSATRTLGVHKIQQSPARNWGETTVSWNKYDGTNSWTTGGGDFAASATATASVGAKNVWANWTVTTDVQSFCDNGATNFGWVLKDETEDDSQQHKQFASKEYGTASRRPKLVVTYEASLPVELTSFTARQERSTAVLEWITESEIDNLGFVLERRRPEAGDWTEIASYRTNLELQGQGSTTSRTNYEYIDLTVEPNATYEYRIADVSYDGIVEFHLMTTLSMTDENVFPLKFGLQPAFPNPFNPATTITVNLIESGDISVVIYDLRGRRIATLMEGRQQAGEIQVDWNAGDIPAGVYFCRLVQGRKQDVQKLILLK